MFGSNAVAKDRILVQNDSRRVTVSPLIVILVSRFSVLPHAQIRKRCFAEKTSMTNDYDQKINESRVASE